MCSISTWFSLQILNFCWWRDNGSSTNRQNVQMYIIVKARCLHSLTLIHNQSFKIKVKTIKNFSTLSWDIYLENFATKFIKVSWWPLWVGHHRNFHNSSFVKNYYLNLNFFFKYCRVLSLKQKKSLTEDASHLKIDWHSKSQQKKLKKERKENEK